jgi:hypothetical protein
MPKRPTAKQGFPCKSEDCYASRHLDGPDYKVWDQMKAAAPQRNGTRIFFAPVSPYLVNACNQARSTIDATLLRLCNSGWIINLGRQRKPDGTETPNKYRIIEHPEWAANHPGRCPDFTVAPDSETARAFGVNVGDKLATGPLPPNFWPKPDTPLGSALRKIIGHDSVIITDEEMAALNAHLRDLTTPGTPGLAPLPVNEAPLPVDRERATPGTPVEPLPVNEDDHSRYTGRNPIEHNRDLPTHTHTLPTSPRP